MCGGGHHGVIQGSLISTALLSLDETVDVGFLWRLNRFPCLSRIPTQPSQSTMGASTGATNAATSRYCSQSQFHARDSVGGDASPLSHSHHMSLRGSSRGHATTTAAASGGGGSSWNSIPYPVVTTIPPETTLEEVETPHPASRCEDPPRRLSWER